jgi:hypothetical protein
MSREDATRKFLDAQRRLVTQASDFSLETIASMVDTKAIDPYPEYQRRDRWDHVRQSALIESFLLNVPVPPVYLAEEDYGVYSVIDGKQRITAIHDFMRGRLTLRSLQELPELDGDTIHDLPDEMANALRMRPYIRAVTLLKQSDPALKYEVFIRLNRGGQALTAQEVRNVAFRGPLNDLIHNLGGHPFLRQQFNITESSERYRQMLDAEYVLRFLALAELGYEFRGDLSATMDYYMLRNSRADSFRLHELELKFLHALRSCKKIWGEHAFRRAENGSWRGRGLLGMYDAQMIAVDGLERERLEVAVNQGSRILEMTEELFEDPEFLKAVTVSTNTPARLHYRVDVMRQVLLNA